MVFDASWEQWVRNWEAVESEHDHVSAGAEPLTRMMFAGKEGSELEGRDISITCEECAQCVLEREMGRNVDECGS